MKSFERAFITGASLGLCQALSARGTPLLLATRNREKLKELAESLRTPTQIYAVDLKGFLTLSPEEVAAAI